MMDKLGEISSWYWVSQYIIPIITYSFGVWMLFLLYKTGYLIYIRIVAAKCKDVSILHDYILSPDKEKDVFREFCRKRGIRKNGPLGRHIQSIFRAGLNNSRLEIAELNKYTENSVFSMNTFLKGFSSIFIIMGLFGTLFGLSMSFTQLQPALSNLKSGQRTNEVADAIDSLFSHLGNAFSPSIFGVGLTIISVIVFSLYLKFVCVPVKNSISYYTINNWVPQLYPTSLQNIAETLEQNEKQMRKNFEAAQKVAEFADEVQTRFVDFGTRLSEANQVLSELSGVLRNFEETSNNFRAGIDGLSSQQDQIKDFYAQVCSNYQKLEEYICTSVDGMNRLQSKIDSTYDEQNSRMGKVVDSFEYLKELNVVNANLASSAERSFSEIGQLNVQIVDALKQPLIQGMNENFTLITRTFAKELERIVNIFNKMDLPLQESAKSIGEVFGSLSMSYDNLSKLIRESVVESNQKIINESITDNKLLVKYVADLVEKTTSITDFLKDQNLMGNFEEYKKRQLKKGMPLHKRVIGFLSRKSRKTT